MPSSDSSDGDDNVRPTPRGRDGEEIDDDEEQPEIDEDNDDTETVGETKQSAISVLKKPATPTRAIARTDDDKDKQLAEQASAMAEMMKKLERMKQEMRDAKEKAKSDPPSTATPWWADHKDFPAEWLDLLPCTINPQINEESRDDEEMARVRRETKIFFASLIEGGWCFPGEPQGSFCYVPSEVLIKLMEFARAAPHLLPWNAMDVDRKVIFIALLSLFLMLLAYFYVLTYFPCAALHSIQPCAHP